MELQRSFLLGGIIISAFLLWNAWQQDYRAPAAEAVQAQSHETDVPAMLTTAKPADKALAETPAIQPIAASRILTVETDVLALEIDRQGGNIISAKLLDYKKSIDEDSPPVQILSPEAGSLYISQSGLVSQMGPDTPTQGQALYQAEADHFVLKEGQETLTIPMQWSKNGVTVTKTLTLQRGDYLIDVNYHINNQTGQNWVGQFYGQFKREQLAKKKDGFFTFATYSGAAISTPEKRYEKVSYKDMDKANLNRSTTGGWLAMLQHYFVSAWVPNPEQNYQLVSYPPSNNVYRIAMLSPTLSVGPNEQLSTGAKFYVGPEITARLKEIAPGLDLTVDYGWFWPISQALFWVLKTFYKFVGNWGLAIILTTLLVKLFFFHLSATSYRSMAKMRKAQPKIEALKERFGDDKQKLSQAIMEMYKKEKINPLGGCLPILVQIPVFIALYWVLIESVELRHAPFYFWIHDLSSKDPFYVLPIIMGASMFLQQRLSPAPPDPTQAKVLMFMPIMFTVLFLNFPAGLVLYWVVNNLLSISQQWLIMRSVEKGSTKK